MKLSDLYFLAFYEVFFPFYFIVQATFYPGLCEPTSQGGLGFDYYVNLSVSEMWSSFLENVPDHEWSMSKVVLFDTFNSLCIK